jgi:hypothetical protein
LASIVTTFDFLAEGQARESVKLLSDLSDFVEDPVSCLLRLFPFCKAPDDGLTGVVPAGVPIST